jgi:phage terminase small subunit
MPALKNPKHERFAQELTTGSTQDAAYAAAGYKPDRGAASRLSANVNIKARVAELKERAAIKVETTVEDIARQLDEDREFARKNAHSSAAVAATLGKAKVLGLIVDKSKVEHGGEVGLVTTIELVGPDDQG